MVFFPPPYHSGRLLLAGRAHMDYVTLGSGPIPLVLIPGGGDGLRTVGDAALQLAWYFRHRLGRYRMLLLSRRHPLPANHSFAQHADDYAEAIERLGWGPALLECNSAGGPIGQQLAVRRPDLVRALVLSCTLHRTDTQSQAVLSEWLRLAHAGRWDELNWSSIVKTYRPRTVAGYRPLRPLLRFMPPPRHPERMIRIFESLLTLDHRELLLAVQAPTLVIGGADDQVILAETQREMAALIPGAHLKLYPGEGHSNDLENPDYERHLHRFAVEVLGR